MVSKCWTQVPMFSFISILKSFLEFFHSSSQPVAFVVTDNVLLNMV